MTNNPTKKKEAIEYVTLMLETLLTTTTENNHKKRVENILLFILDQLEKENGK